MTCSSPSVVRLKGHIALMRIPCGSCLPCRIARARQWTTRLCCEWESWDRVGCFITLTYDEGHFPEDGSLRREVAQLWLKRFRKLIAPVRVRYYLCGEYGSAETYYSRSQRRWVKGSERPHYHVIVFGWEPDWKGDCARSGNLYHVLRGPLVESWRNGFVGATVCCEQTMRYTASYVTSKLTGALAAKSYGSREAPFSLQSQGIGRAFCDQYADELRSSLAINRNGHTEGLPRYFARRLGVGAWDTHDAKMAHAMEVYEHHLKIDPSQLRFIQHLGDSFLDFPTVHDAWRQNGIEAERRQLFTRRNKV